MTLAEQSRKNVESAWNSAAANWDIDALSAIYVDEAMLFGGLPNLSVGKVVIREYFASYVGILKSVKMRMVDQTIVQANQDTYVAQGFVDFVFDLVDGNTINTTMRTTWVIVQRDNQAKLLAHHFSNIPAVPPTATNS